MQALITGGTGFIGGALSARLRAGGARVRLVSRGGGHGEEHVAASVTDGAAMTRAARGCDWLFHLAAREDVVLGRDAFGDRMFETNVVGTRRVLAAAREAGVKRVVVVTSVTTAGYAGDGVANDGSAAHNVSWFDSVYVVSRLQQERECLEAAALGQEVVICAPGGVVGVGDKKSSAPILEAFVRGRVPAVPPGGFNWIAVDDVAAGLVAAAERGRSGRRYLFVNENLTWAALLARAGALAGRPPPRLVLPKTLVRTSGALATTLARLVGMHPGMAGWARLLGERFYASARVAVEEIGLPQTPIDAALRDAVQAAMI